MLPDHRPALVARDLPGPSRPGPGTTTARNNTIIPITTWPEATATDDNPADPGQIIVTLSAPRLPGDTVANPAD